MAPPCKSIALADRPPFHRERRAVGMGSAARLAVWPLGGAQGPTCYGDGQFSQIQAALQREASTPPRAGAEMLSQFNEPLRYRKANVRWQT